MSGKGSLSSKAWINNAIRYDLSWALHHLQSLPGTHIIPNLKWDPPEADVIIHVDTCLEGMGFWYTDEPVGILFAHSTYHSLKPHLLLTMNHAGVANETCTKKPSDAMSLEILALNLSGQLNLPYGVKAIPLPA